MKLFQVFIIDKQLEVNNYYNFKIFVFLDENELKQNEIQDPENLEASNPTDPEGKRRREARLRIKLAQDNDIDKSLSDPSTDNLANSASHQGWQVNITI